MLSIFMTLIHLVAATIRAAKAMNVLAAMAALGAGGMDAETFGLSQRRPGQRAYTGPVLRLAGPPRQRLELLLRRRAGPPVHLAPGRVGVLGQDAAAADV